MKLKIGVTRHKKGNQGYCSVSSEHVRSPIKTSNFILSKALPILLKSFSINFIQKNPQNFYQLIKLKISCIWNQFCSLWEQSGGEIGCGTRAGTDDWPRASKGRRWQNAPFTLPSARLGELGGGAGGIWPKPKAGRGALSSGCPQDATRLLELSRDFNIAGVKLKIEF